MKLRDAVTPVVLVVLAAGAAAYATFADRGRPSDAERQDARGRVFPGLRVQDVTRLRIEHPGDSLEVERGEDAGPRWVLVGSHPEPADDSTVDVLLHELQSASRIRAVEEGSAQGLGSPRARGRIDVGPLVLRFELGADTLRPQGAAYLRVEGEGTFVVEEAVKEALLRAADTYRDRTLVPVGASGVEQVEVRAASGATMTLARHGATFRSASDGLRVSRAAVDHLLSSLSDARVERFLDDEALEARAKPATTVIVTPRDGSHPRVELAVGGACPDAPDAVVVARRSPSPRAACVANRIVEVLGAIPLAPDPSPFFARADEMAEVRLEPVSGDGPHVDLARRGSGWHERAPEDHDLTSDESDMANALASALANAIASSVRAPSPQEPFEPRSRVTIVRVGTSDNETIELSAPSADGTVVARRSDDGAVLTLPRSVARRFEPHPIALHGRSVWARPFDAASVVAIDDTCGPTPQRLALVDTRWTFVRSPRGFPVDPVTVTAMTKALSGARAEAWIAEKDDGDLGFGSSAACTVRLELATSSGDAAVRATSIVFGAAGDGGVYARTQDAPDVFVAPNELWQALGHPALDRSAFRFDATELTDVALDRGGHRRALSLQDGGDDRLLAAVSGLLPVAALHTGPPALAEGMDHPTLDLFVTSRAPPPAAPVPTHVTVGAETTVDGAPAYFARTSRMDATFALPKKAVDELRASPPLTPGRTTQSTSPPR